MIKFPPYIALFFFGFLGCSVAIAQEQDFEREQLMLSFKRQVVEGQINTVVRYNKLWVFGGGFKSSVNRSLDYIAGWDGSYFRPLMSGLTDSVHVLKVNGSHLFVGGSFKSDGSQVFNGIVKWDGAQWVPQGKGVNGSVYAIAIVGNYVYIGGNFSQSGSNKVANIARRSLEQLGSEDEWQAVDNGTNGPIYALYAVNNRLIVGGSFNRAGNITAQNIVEWDGLAWKAIGAGLQNPVLAIEVHQSVIHASGTPSNQGINAGNSIIYRFEGSWIPVGQPLKGKVKSLKSHENNLYIGGEFTSPHPHLTKWDGSNLTDIGGADREVNALEISNDVLMIAGRFTSSLNKRNALFETSYLKKPTIPTILQPTQNQTSISTTPTVIEWSNSENTQSILVQYWLKDKLENKDSLLTTITVEPSPNYITLNLKGSTAYGLRIKAINELDSSAWTPTVSFTTRIGSPKLLYPYSTTQGLGKSITFSWEAVPNATRYILNVIDQLTQGWQTNITEIISDSTRFTINNAFQNNTLYEWRVKAENNAEFSDFSAPVSFRVKLKPESPVLIIPSDNTRDLARSTLQLRWSPVISADYYLVEYYTDSTDLRQVRIPASTFFFLENLKENTDYFWRVRAVNDSGEGLSPWRKFTTGVSSLGEVTMLLPTTNKTNELRTPVLTWRSVKHATKYRVQMARSLSDLVSNNPDRLTVNVVVSDTTYQVRDLAKSTNYIWQVRAENDAGVVGPPPSTRFSFTTINADLPDRVTLLSPVSNLTNAAYSLRFEWNSVTGATAYRLQLSNRADYASVILDEKNLTTTQKELSNLRPSSSYYWRVSASNGAGEGNWSTVRTFETASTLPEIPTITHPINASTEIPLLTKVTWGEVLGAEKYIIFRDVDPGFSSVDRDSFTTTLPTITFPNSLPVTSYFIKVKALNNKGMSEWSEVVSYTTTIRHPEPVTLIEPTNSKRLTNDLINLRWSTSSGADYYWIQISTDPQFISIDRTYEKVTDNFYVLPKGDVFTPLYWRVMAVNRAGESAWSPVYSFTSFPKQPSKPSNLKPVSNLDYSGNQINLSWDAESLVDEHQVQVARSPLFDPSTLIIDTNLLDNKLSIDTTKVQKDTRYHWRVRTRYKSANSDWSLWSDTLNFRTLPPNPPTPRIIKPLTNEENVVLPVQVEWTQVENADEYYLFVYKESEPDNKAIELTKSNLYSIRTSLDFNTPYCIEVRAVNSRVGISSFNSSSVCFKTIEAPPATPLLSSPTDSTQKLTRVQQFKWLKTAGAREYLFELAKNRTFTELLYSKSIKNPVDTTVSYSLEYNTTYFWRVKASNIGGSSTSKVSSISTYNYNKEMLVSISIDFFGTKQEDYRLVGISGNYDVQYDVYNIFGPLGKPNFDWVVYEEKGTQLLSQSTITKCDNEENRCRFRPGKGFWLLSKSTWKYDNTFPTRSLDVNEMDSIPLNQGWNIISNPLDKSILWSEVIKANNLKSPGSILHAFDKNYIPVSDFNINQGYYFYNATGLSFLKLPYFTSVTVPKLGLDHEHHQGMASQASENPSLRLRVEDQQQRSLGIVEVHFNALASRGYDQYDIPSPPLNFASSYFAFVNDSLPQGTRLFYSISVPRDLEHYSYPLTLKVDKTALYRIGFESEWLESPYTVQLLNHHTGKSVALNRDEVSSINLVKGEQSFTLILTKLKENGSQHSPYIPSRFELYYPYPNPFNPTTTITVAMPTVGHMSLRIYDITGRLISELSNGSVNAGLHSFEWNASRNASGVYLIEAISDKQRQFKKITLIK
jgi:hypothetical protein